MSKPDYVKCEKCVYWFPFKPVEDKPAWKGECRLEPIDVGQKRISTGNTNWCSHFTREWPGCEPVAGAVELSAKGKPTKYGWKIQHMV